MTSKKYVYLVFTITIFILSIICVLNYIVDPFFQFRVRDGKYILTSPQVNPGLCKNYECDYVVIGSSMVQTYDMGIFRERFNCNPLKVGVGGMRISDAEVAYSLLKKENINTFLINLDFFALLPINDTTQYASHLYKDGVLNNIKYLLNYETNRFTPVDILTTVYTRYAKEIPIKLEHRIMIDKVGDYGVTIDYNGYNLKRLYINREKEDSVDMYNRMTTRMDNFFKYIELSKNEDKEYIFLLSPYSAAYWKMAKEEGYYDKYINTIKHLVNKYSTLKNVRIVCLFDSDFIVNWLDYADLIHFSTKYNNLNIDAIESGSKDLTIENFDYRMARLDSLVNVFTTANKDWVKPN